MRYSLDPVHRLWSTLVPYVGIMLYGYVMAMCPSWDAAQPLFAAVMSYSSYVGMLSMGLYLTGMLGRLSRVLRPMQYINIAAKAFSLIFKTVGSVGHRVLDPLTAGGRFAPTTWAGRSASCANSIACLWMTCRMIVAFTPGLIKNYVGVYIPDVGDYVPDLGGMSRRLMSCALSYWSNPLSNTTSIQT